MDPVSGKALVALGEKAAEELSTETKDFVAAVSGGPVAELGAWLADYVRLHRWKAQHRIIERARNYADEAGYSPGTVSLKILAPLLEGASLEDLDGSDADEMAARWAALLANAAGRAEVLPSFPAMLREMTPLDARLLDAIVRAETGQNSDGSWHALSGVAIDELLDPTPEVDDALVAADNLLRLRLVAFPTQALGFDPATGKMSARGEFPSDGLAGLLPTPLGRAFHRACQPPVRSGR